MGEPRKVQYLRHDLCVVSPSYETTYDAAVHYVAIGDSLVEGHTSSARGYRVMAQRFVEAQRTAGWNRADVGGRSVSLFLLILVTGFQNPLNRGPERTLHQPHLVEASEIDFFGKRAV